MNLNKLKSQKGLTGIDVVIAITLITTITIAVLAIYVNLIAGSKRNSRTSNASRIATSILQNIDSMYYADVEQELIDIGTDAGILTNTNKNASFKVTVTNTNIFKTNIPSGYEVVLDATEIDYNTDKQDTLVDEEGNTLYGASVANCPLLWNIAVTVNYDVSGREEHITLKTIKKREVLQVSNEPDLNTLIGKYNYAYGTRFKIKSLKQVQPIKWSMIDGLYVKTNSSDPEWYNYLNKDWAKVIVFPYDINMNAFSGATGTITDDAINTLGLRVFVWIPRYGVSAKDSSIAFAYGSSNARIQKLQGWVYPGGTSGSCAFYFWGVKCNSRPMNWSRALEENLKVDSNNFPDGSTGVWLDVTGGSVQGCNYSEISNPANIPVKLQGSIFGPPTEHYSNRKFY